MSLFRYVTATKWTAKALLIAYATYACHHEIEKAVNTVEFYFSKNLRVETTLIFLNSGEPGSLSEMSKTP